MQHRRETLVTIWMTLQYEESIAPHWVRHVQNVSLYCTKRVQMGPICVCSALAAFRFTVSRACTKALHG